MGKPLSDSPSTMDLSKMDLSWTDDRMRVPLCSMPTVTVTRNLLLPLSRLGDYVKKEGGSRLRQLQ